MSSLEINRRTALAALGATGAGAFFASARAQDGIAPGGQPGRAGGARATLSPQQLGWNDQRGEYVLPDLPYGPDELEPHIDAETMRLHHDRHHQGYVDGLNKAMQELRNVQMGQGDPSLVEHWVRELSFNGGGHVNHTLFWNMMSPSGGGEPQGELARQIEADFGSFNQFLALFQQAAKSVQGSGWGWLAYEPIAGRLIVTQMHDQEDKLFTGLVPILGVDVWEHAYYKKYGPDRQAYLDAFTNVINWDFCGRLYSAARRGSEAQAGGQGQPRSAPTRRLTPDRGNAPQGGGASGNR